MLSGGPLDDKYNILQIHFHWGNDSSRGSEHTYDNTKFPLEMHIVHVKEGLGLNSSTPDFFLNFIDGLAVTGFMFNLTVKESCRYKIQIFHLKSIPGPK